MKPATSLILPWTPHAKGRPRMTKSGHAYTPPRTRKAEAEILQAFLDETERGWFPFPYEDHLAVQIALEDEEFIIDMYEVPRYENRKLRGDVDNYAKTILDALNGYAWVDDRQITSLKVKKL